MATPLQVHVLYQLAKEMSAYTCQIGMQEKGHLNKLSADFLNKMYAYRPLTDDFMCLYDDILESDRLAAQCYEVLKYYAQIVEHVNQNGDDFALFRAQQAVRDLLIKIELSKAILDAQNTLVVISIGGAGDNEQIAPHFMRDKKVFNSSLVLNIDPMFTHDRKLVLDDVNVQFFKGCLNLPSEENLSIYVHRCLMESIRTRLDNDSSFHLVIISSFENQLADIAVELAKEFPHQVQQQLEIVGNHGGLSAVVRYHPSYFTGSGFEPLSRNSGSYFHSLSKLSFDKMEQPAVMKKAKLDNLLRSREFLQMVKQAELEIVQGRSDREIFFNLNSMYPLAEDRYRHLAIAVAELVRETGLAFQSNQFIGFYEETFQRADVIENHVRYFQEGENTPPARLAFADTKPDPFLAMVKPINTGAHIRH